MKQVLLLLAWMAANVSAEPEIKNRRAPKAHMPPKPPKTLSRFIAPITDEVSDETINRTRRPPKAEKVRPCGALRRFSMGR